MIPQDYLDLPWHQPWSFHPDRCSPTRAGGASEAAASAAAWAWAGYRGGMGMGGYRGGMGMGGYRGGMGMGVGMGAA